MSIKRFTAFAAFAVVLTMFSVAPSFAQTSRIEHDRFTETRILIDKGGCPFPISVSSVANIDDALFFNEDGKLVRVHETVNHAEITFSANGKSLTAKGSGGIDYRFNPDGTIVVDTFGINLLLVIPGHGPVFLDVGRAEFLFDGHLHVLFWAGPANYDAPTFCAALGK